MGGARKIFKTGEFSGLAGLEEKRMVDMEYIIFVVVVLRVSYIGSNNPVLLRKVMYTSDEY